MLDHAPILQVDARLLNRPGQAMRALALWWRAHPGDFHPTIKQLAEVAQVPWRNMQRALDDAAELGLILLSADRGHHVGRSIHPMPEVVAPPMPLVAAPPMPEVVPHATSGMPEVAGGGMPEVAHHSAATSGMPEVVALRNVRSNEEYDNVLRGGATCGMGEESPLHRGLQARMKKLGSPELQMVDAPPPAQDFKPSTLFSRLDLAVVNPHDLAAAVARLAGEFGLDYRPFYLKVCTAVSVGTEPVAKLIEAYEEAHRQGVKHRGKAFIHACKRTMRTFMHETEPRSDPTLGANRQVSPSVG